MNEFLERLKKENKKEGDGFDSLSIRVKHKKEYAGFRLNYKFPDISFEQFSEKMFDNCGGCLDIDYVNYLRMNDMIELSSFNSEDIKNLYLVVENGERKIIFKAVYDSKD